MFRLILAVFLLMPTLAFAQSQRNPCYINSKGGCTPVGTSGAPNGAQPMPVTASVSASISGFNQESVLTPITATTGGATSSAFTAGKVIVVSNVGSTNTAYCRLGGSSTTSGQPILPGSWFAFTSVLETTVTCATSTSTTTVNVSVGTGLPTGAGGGSSSGGGSGGAVTIADGADTTQGAIADAASSAGGTGTLSAKARLMTTQLGTINTTLGSPFQAGGSIGNTSFGISGTLPAFGSTPTFNLGTLNGAATAANQTNASQKSQIVDGSGNVIGATANALDVNIKSGGGSGGTSSNFGATFPTAGTASGMSQGGNMVALTGTSGNLNVQCANCSGSGASGTDQGAFTAGASTFAPSGGVYQTSATSNPLTNGQWGTWQLTANRAGFVNLRNTAGAEIGGASIPLRTDPTGTTTQPVSGTVTANVGTGTRPISIASAQVASGAIAAGAQVDLLTMRGTKNAGTAAANSILAGSVYNSTPLTLTDGQGASLQGDANGFLKVNIAAGSSSGAVTQGSTTSGQSGNLMQGAVTTSAPTYTTAQTNPLSLDTSGNLRTVVTSAVGLSQGSTTSGQTGSMIMGAVTTSAPTYTTAQTSPISLDTAGSIRVNPGTVTVTATNLSVNNAQINGVTPLMGNGTTGTGSQRVTIANDSSAIAVKGEGATGATVPTGAQLQGVQSGANMVAQLQASASAAINVSTATTTQLVALSGSTKIYVTSYDVIAGGTGNITFVYGTGTNCGTGTTSLTGAYNLIAQAGIAKGSGMGPVLIVPAGNALCVTTSAAVQMSGSVSYTQF